MSGGLEVLCGTAGSGKTARLLDLFRLEQARLLKTCSPGEAVWITPTNRSRREIMRRLLDASLRACLAPNVLTFDSFAERLLRTSGSQIAMLSPVARRMLARTVIDEAQRAGSLPHYAPIAQTSGFLDLFLDSSPSSSGTRRGPSSLRRPAGSAAGSLEMANCRFCTAITRTGSTNWRCTTRRQVLVGPVGAG